NRATPGYDLLTDDASKDDEERRLESILFGTKYVQRDTDTQAATADDLDERLGNEMQNLLDHDLFFLDDGLDSSNPARGEDLGAAESVHTGDDSEDESQSDGDSQPSFSESDSQSSGSGSSKRHSLLRSRKPPAWSDPADHQNEPPGDSIRDLLLSTSGPDAESRSRKTFARWNLGIERLRDINQSTQGSGEVNEKVPVVCVGTTDRRYRLFNGSSLLLTGPRPFFYVHDFQSGATVRHSRGLWGTTFSTTNDAVRVDRRGKRGRDNSGNGAATAGGGEGLEISAFSPDTGDLLAVAGRGGYIHLVDWNSGAGQVVGSLKCGGGGGGIKSLWWTSENDGANAALGGGAAMNGDAEVYIWDVGERKCIRRWKDDGGFRGAGGVMTGSRGGHDGKGGWLAVGSNTGFVNVYGSDSFRSPPSFNNDLPNPKPIKSIANLTTAVSTLMFNHDAQILAVASREKRDAMRLIHLPSLTSFSNWPTEYIAIGNTRGKVLLYHLKEYGYGSIPSTL
ncbi:WD40-repeat-containing domain protein, partial [Infundibulicybe gibba]